MVITTDQDLLAGRLESCNSAFNEAFVRLVDEIGMTAAIDVETMIRSLIEIEHLQRKMVE